MAANPNEKLYSEQEKRLLHLYGKLPRKGDLLSHQLEVRNNYIAEAVDISETNEKRPKPQSRQFFDSGDFALAQANIQSDAGAVQTGKEHPTSKTISHPSAPVPGSSNVRKASGEQHRDGRTMCEAPNSHLRRDSLSDGFAAAGRNQAENDGLCTSAAVGSELQQRK
ncbi:hypothetical protein BFW01_g10214 [Lasiodiplodia theobromae]|uniref:mRNA stability protein n=1 Tax=Lasiodiplodia theobromae TaxID=45133 RepID=A0A8H7INN0_9PEZI|nr:hypothetical protein BFW01_g10214 [Lasiodiplodia theobromae]